MENKILNALKKVIIITGVSSLAIFIPGVFNFGIISILTNITAIVFYAGIYYIGEVKKSLNTKLSKKIEIPQSMKLNGSNIADENMKRQAIYSKTPEELGLEKTDKKTNSHCSVASQIAYKQEQKEIENAINTLDGIYDLGSKSVENIISDMESFSNTAYRPVFSEMPEEKSESKLVRKLIPPKI